MKLQAHTADEILALMVANAPDPSASYIELHQRLDYNRNPHNDPYPKPPVRSKEEIIADYKIEFGRTLFQRLKMSLNKNDV